ncbi:MAG: 2-haloacrylate reductase [Pseudomonadales bacterium]|nr:2-haloacrylate reductase [Pseudomonadales bacterium]
MNPSQTTMRAVVIHAPGGPEVLQERHLPIPAPGPGEVLIRVAFAGINRPDVLQRQGLYPAPPGASDLPGLEVAGEIVATGAGGGRWRVGDRVCALLNGGGYAQYALAPQGQCLPVPRGLTLAEAAALPETTLTVWHNVFERAGLRRGELLLVHGGASGIGSTAIQLAHALGARVIATAGSAAKCLACVEMGADLGVNYHDEDFVERTLAHSGGRGADVILDMVGGDYVQRNIRAAAEDGRIVQIAFLRGAKTAVDLMPLMLKRLTLTGSTLRARSAAFKATLARGVEQHVWPLVEAGRIRARIDSMYPLVEAGAAHRHMESGAHIGKIVLQVD